MGSCVVYGKIYIFGGNINGPEKENDEYTNDLYELELKGFTIVSKKLIVDGPVPSKRLSHSMTNLYNRYLIVYGGEIDEKELDDL